MFLFGQNKQYTSAIILEIENNTDIVKPNILSNHPLGIFVSRLNHNFNVRSSGKFSVSFDYGSGNTFLPFVKSNLLTNMADQQKSAPLAWHEREYNFDLMSVPSKVNEFIADGVLRSYRLTFSMAFSRFHEITMSLRANSLDPGNYPFSIFTADESIEWFHSNIAGGEDPFSRIYYGVNQAGINFNDENSKSLIVKDGDFLIPGVEINYSYFPKLKMNKTKGVFLNLNTHFGFNTSKFNSSTDIGLSASIIKKRVFYQKKIMTFGLSAGALRQNIFNNNNKVSFSNQKMIFSAEAQIDYKKKLNNSNSLSYGLNYTYQSPYNSNSDFKYVVLSGQRIKTHWEQTLKHLYHNLSALSFLMTYSVREKSYYAYIRQDTQLNNAPDLQTGIGFKYAVLTQITH